MAENTPIKIRTFKAEDIDQIFEIESQAFPKTSYPKEVLLSYANRSSYRFLVIETGKDLLGYIIFSRDGHIISTVVKPAFRRRGIGRMLFTYALNHADKKLWLEVRSRNDMAIKFYENMGMKKNRTTRNYYGDDDALIMVSCEKGEAR
jgi:ribosomal-protein-alanine N-acetyltransferase